MSLGHLTALGQRARFQVLPSVGTFGYEPQPRTLFGLVRGIEAHGLYMNARASVQIASHDGDPEARSALNLQTGLLGSALEHAIPEQMFTDPDAAEPTEAVSAVKALGMAMQQGQRIYELTAENMAETLPKLHLGSQAMGEITRALQTGQQVIAHTDPVEVPGWRGAGYILLDPLTGDGAYKISGGKNGSHTGVINEANAATFILSLIDKAKECLSDSDPSCGLLYALLSGVVSLFSPLLGVLLTLLALKVSVDGVVDSNLCEADKNTLIGFLVGAAALALLFGFFWGGVASLLFYIIMLFTVNLWVSLLTGYTKEKDFCLAG